MEAVVTTLAPLLESFFTECLQRQKRASPNTIAAYRDTFRLLLAFAKKQLGKQPSDLLLVDLDADLIGDVRVLLLGDWEAERRASGARRARQERRARRGDEGLLYGAP